MKWIKCKDRLPKNGFSVAFRLRKDIPLNVGKSTSIQAYLDGGWDEIEWLDEESPSFSISDIILVWAKAQEVTIENTSFDLLNDSIDPDYSYIEKERNEFFIKQFGIDLTK